MKPRKTLRETRAQGQLQRDFFKEYLHAHLLGGNDRKIADAFAIFEGETLAKLRQRLSPEALATPLRFTDRLTNRRLAAHLTYQDGTRFIVFNARYRADPEQIAHTLIEEYVHAQQTLDGVDTTAQKRQYVYGERPYEQEAKQIATEILGYDAEEHVPNLRREEPEGELYDRTSDNVIIDWSDSL